MEEKKDKLSQTPFKRKGRPNLLNDNLLIKIKDVMIWIWAARLLVIAIGKGVVKAKNPTIPIENGGPLELSEYCSVKVFRMIKAESSDRKGGAL